MKKIILAISLFSIFDTCRGADSIPSSSSNGHLQPCVSCKLFETDNLRLELIDSAEKDTACYLAIYQDCGWRNPWFSGSSTSVYPDNFNTPHNIGMLLGDDVIDPVFESQHERIQEKDIENFKTKEKTGFYSQLDSFPNYIIFDRQTNELVGKFIFCQSVRSGRIEKGTYILSKFRGKGYAPEALTGVMRNVIDPALGKPFVAEGVIYREFKGIYSKISPWHNYPSLKANFKAGSAIRWMDYCPITFYPAGEDAFLDPSNELQSFLNVIYLTHVMSATLPFDARTKHIDLKLIFLFIRGLEDKIKNPMIKDLYNLVMCGDESTAAFAQKALNVLEEEL